VNALGEVVDPSNGRIIAGARSPQGGFLRTLDVLAEQAGGVEFAGSNTTIGVVATNAALTKEHTSKVAQMAQDGLARAVIPAHTLLDGDTIFSLSLGKVQADVSLVGALAAEIFARAVLQAVYMAVSLGGLPALRDLAGSI